jgi:hypothetical protein
MTHRPETGMREIAPLPCPPLGSSTNCSRRQALLQLGAVVAGVIAQPLVSRAAHASASQPTGQPRTMTVFKSPTCGCCTAWIEHVEKAGFKCTVRDFADLTEVKRTFGIPRALESCHTAQVGTYVVEGHVPADLIVKMLREKPVGRGLAVPGMPIGSPGMEGGTPERYQVLFLNKDGTTRVFATR